MIEFSVHIIYALKANFAAINANGYPVALDAKAEDLDNL